MVSLLSNHEALTVSYLTGVSSNGLLTPQTFWTWNQDYPATYSSATNDAHKWANDASGNSTSLTSVAGTPGGTVTYAFNPADSWTAVQQQAFIATLTLWSDEANIQFSEVSTPSAADVLLSLGSGTGSYETSAPAVTGSVGTQNIPDEITPSTMSTQQAGIIFDTSGGYGTLGSLSPGGDYGYSSLVHEVGHLLGLGHSGPYSDSETPTQVEQAQASAFDSRQWSIMSYINPDDTAAAYYSAYPVTGTNWTATTTTTNANGGTTTYFNPIAPQTPMPLDILAAQQLYGSPTVTALSGGQVFGFNCNITDASEPLFDFSKNLDPVLTLWDAGTDNTLDLSGYSTASTVDLLPGTFSSVDLLTNNIGIAYGTQIDSAIGGAGNDTFIVNNDNDSINGEGGSNTVVFGGERAQYSISGTKTSLNVMNEETGASDQLLNVQTLQFSDEALLASNYAQTSTGAPSDFSGNGTSDILFQNADGTIDVWQTNGSSIVSSTVVANPSTAWTAVGTGDFNGDGKADILFQNQDGTIDIWEMNGAAIASSAAVADPGVTWHAVGIGDFYGTGSSDILFQNNDGTVDIWQTNGQSLLSSTVVANPSTAWEVVGVGDFNGDGKSDILLQNTNGTLDVWTMNGASIASSNVIANPSTAWHVVGTGDFNNDGKSDIVLQNNDGTVNVWEMNGSALTSSTEVADPGPTWHAIAAGDYNGDGKPDILFQNDNGAIDVWDMNGTSIASSGIVANPSTAWQAIGQGNLHFIDGTQSTGTLTATPLADNFVFTSSAAGSHVIAGFDPANDVITLNQSQFPSYAALQSAESTVNGSVMITLGTSDTLAIQGVTPAQLAAKNFV